MIAAGQGLSPQPSYDDGKLLRMLVLFFSPEFPVSFGSFHFSSSQTSIMVLDRTLGACWAVAQADSSCLCPHFAFNPRRRYACSLTEILYEGHPLGQAEDLGVAATNARDRGLTERHGKLAG